MVRIYNTNQIHKDQSISSTMFFYYIQEVCNICGKEWEQKMIRNPFWKTDKTKLCHTIMGVKPMCLNIKTIKSKWLTSFLIRLLCYWNSGLFKLKFSSIVLSFEVRKKQLVRPISSLVVTVSNQAYTYQYSRPLPKQEQWKKSATDRAPYLLVDAWFFLGFIKFIKLSKQ